MGVIEKVSGVPGHTVEAPEIEGAFPGVPALTLTACVKASLVPQSFAAFTVIFPPAVPVVTVIEEVVLVPVQPVGSVQMYSVAPATGELTV